MKKFSIALALALVLAACAPFAMIEAKRQTIGDSYSVLPTGAWNKAGFDKFETWTVDGLALQLLRFYAGIKDGDAIFVLRGRKDDQQPKFRVRMTPSDIMELVADGLSGLKITDIKTTHLRPHKFGGLPGFRFDISYFNTGGLAYRGVVVGAVKDKELNMILFRGTKLHYFDSKIDEVEQIIQSVRMS